MKRWSYRELQEAGGVVVCPGLCMMPGLGVCIDARTLLTWALRADPPTEAVERIEQAVRDYWRQTPPDVIDEYRRALGCRLGVERAQEILDEDQSQP